MRRLLCEFAQAAARSRCALKDKFTALTIRCAVIQHHLALNPFDAAWYLFRNKASTRLKVVVFDGAGFWQ